MMRRRGFEVLLVVVGLASLAGCGEPPVEKLWRDASAGKEASYDAVNRLSDSELVQLVLDWVGHRASVARAQQVLPDPFHRLVEAGDELVLGQLIDAAIVVLARRKRGRELACLVDAYSWDGGGAWLMRNALLLCDANAIEPLSQAKSGFAHRILDALRRGDPSELSDARPK